MAELPEQAVQSFPFEISELPPAPDDGDNYELIVDFSAKTFSWVKREEPETGPTVDDRLASLEAENKTLTAKLSAAIESNSMLEECIVEMASVVYA